MATRGQIWFDQLALDAPRVDGLPGSVLAADVGIGAHRCRLLSVVPDPANPYPRARSGEVGLREGWGLARAIRQAMAEDEGGAKRALLAIVDVPSQAYGRREEMLGIHLACAAAVDAYASARLAGHPVVALLVGAAMSGAFLAHGYQAHRLLAFDDPGVVVHAMGRHAAARVTRRSVDELDALGEMNPPMSYRIADFARFGLVHELLQGIDADAPQQADRDRVQQALQGAIADIGPLESDLRVRHAGAAAEARAATAAVRRKLAEQW